MSADAWSACPAGCSALGERRTFREDWELGRNDPEMWGEDEEGKAPCVIVKYHGQCQTCGLEIKIDERFLIEMPAPPKNEPTGFVVRRPWSAIPVGYFVRAPKGNDWYEVMETREMHSDLQLVVLKLGGNLITTQRPRDQEVHVRRGSLANPSADALNTFGPGTSIIEDQIL